MESASDDYYKHEKVFAGKNIVVTGATGEIGFDIASKLITYGANKVIAVGKNERKLKDKYNKFMSSANFEYEVINLEDPQMINRGFRNIMLKLKGKLDSLVFCHGKFFSGNIKETSILLFDNAMNINFRSYFHFLSLATPFLKLSKGNVCFTTCNLGKNPQENTFLFSLTNSMLYSLVENSALELAPYGVRVNAVSPFLVNTNFRVGLNNMTEQENFDYLNLFEKQGLFILGQEVPMPKHVSDSILFLISEDSSYMTGEIINLDAAYSLNHYNTFGEKNEYMDMDG